MRVPSTLKGLYAQLAASPVPIQRIQIPTKDGPLVLEFMPGVHAVPPAPPPEKRQPVVEEETAKPRQRDTHLLNKQAPPMVYES